MTELEIIKRRLSEYYEPDEIERWLILPHPQLEGRSAQDVIASGDADAVSEIIDRLDSAGYI